MHMRTTDTRDGTASAARTVASIVGGRTLQEAPGGSSHSVNPARTDERVAEVLLGDAGTYVAACRAAREAQEEWAAVPAPIRSRRSEEHTSELQSRQYLVCRLLLEKNKMAKYTT